MMKGSHKLAKVEGGVCHFADIRIELVQSDFEIAPDIRSVDGVDSNWISAAKRGVRDAIDAVEMKRWRLKRIDKLEGTLSDTTLDGIWLAAVLAAMEALGKQDNIRSVQLQEGHWLIDMSGGKQISSELK